MKAVGYEIKNTLCATDNSQLLLALEKETLKPVTLKCPKEAFPSEENIKKLHSECSLLQRLEHCSIIKAHKVDVIEGKTFLIRDYFEGVGLDLFLSKGPMELEDFLVLAIELCDALSSVHEAGIVHGNLSPSCILLNESKNAIKLTGFGYTALVHKTRARESIVPLEHKQIYKSPEQSGRLKYEVDHRADIYTLGVIFYQMLSAQIPASSRDSIGLVHSLIAKQTLPLLEVRPETPAVISRIVEKMMAKTPSQRYIQLSSVRVDLMTCLQALHDKEINRDFEIDRLGEMSHFDLTQKVHGREKELQQLLDVFETTIGGPAALACVSGDSGVGKSHLTDFMLKQIEERSTYVVKAKFDQYKENTSFEIVHLALRNLVKQILGEEEAVLEFYKKRLLDALGSQAQTLIDLIPELEIVMGAQPAVEELSSSDAKVRLNSLLCRFIQVFSSSERPLCLFLDDIQWANAATVEWLQTALFDLSYVFIAVAYRDKEVYEGEAFYTMLNALDTAGRGITKIEVGTLGKETISEIVSEKIELDAIEELTGIIFQKTQGNAFFVMHYLKQLQKDGILWFDPASISWHCNMNRLRSLPVSDNVLIFLSERVLSLPEDVQSLLKAASCIGNRFEEGVLKSIYNADYDFSSLMRIARREGWIITENEESMDADAVYYLFTHDRMQQAVKSLLDRSEIEQIHLAIGRHILKSYHELAHQDLFECVNHLNEAQTLLQMQEERTSLAELNRKASLQAKQEGDFESALVYIKRSMGLFPGLPTHERYRDILKERAECEHLCNNADEAIEYYNRAISASASTLERASVYELMIKFYTDSSNFEKAYEIGRTATESLDMKLPLKFNPLSLAADFLHLTSRLKSYKIPQLLDLPPVQDEKIKMLIRLLSALLKVAYQIKPELSVAISVKLVALCLSHGNTREAVVGYMVFGVIFQGGVLGRHKIGYRYGQLCLNMLERFNNTVQRAEVEFVNSYFANSWLNPSADSEQNWREAYRHGLVIGDWFHTGCAAAGIVQSMFMRGVACEEIIEEIETFETTLKRIGAHEQYGAVQSVRQVVRNLQGKTHSPITFSEEDFDESSYINSLSAYGSRHFAHYYYINKMISLYLHKKYTQALKITHKSKKFMADSTGMLHGTEHHFYHALITAKLYPKTNVLKRRNSLRVVYKARKRFKKWAEHSPENFLARKMILEGELHRLHNHTSKALECYESAIQASRIYAQVHLHAMANTLAADLYETMKQPKAADLYRNTAAVSFKQWGVSLCSDDLGSKALSDTAANNFDVRTLMKAAEVISKEQQLPDLLKALIRIIIENAGAQHGVVLLHDSAGLKVQASASIDTERVNVMQAKPYLECETIMHSIVNYVLRSREAIILDNAQESVVFAHDKDVRGRKIKAVLCAPLIFHGEIRGIIYLENNLVPGVFTEEGLELIRHLSSHIAISIDNALIYDHLQQKVTERTRDLDIKNEVLKTQNMELQNQNEKILELHTLIVKENEERKKVEIKLQAAVEQLDISARTDVLTNLHNRRSFDQYLQQECSRLLRQDEPMSFILCDVDFFKAYNDHYGHQKGDECLREVADVLVSCMKRPADFVARYGGEEFAIIMPQTKLEGAMQIADAIHHSLNTRQLSHKGSKIADAVTISIGLAVSDSLEVCTPDSIINIADTALYRAKNSGRNTTVCYSQT